MEQDSPPPGPRRVRPLAVGEAGPAGAESGALVQWTPPHAPSQLGECRLRALYEATPVPKQGPAWQRWLTRHPVQYEARDGATKRVHRSPPYRSSNDMIRARSMKDSASTARIVLVGMCWLISLRRRFVLHVS